MNGGGGMSRRPTAAPVDILDAQAGAELFDQIARTYMGISGGQFLQRWKAGVYANCDWDDVPGLAEVATALPFAS
jgi:hypothetical protein